MGITTKRLGRASCPDLKWPHQEIPQRRADSLPDRIWDVVIVGAGPAGSAAALALASLGHSVLLIEKERFPREKTCGDALIGEALRWLQERGLYGTVRQVGLELKNMSVFSPRGIELEIPGAYLTVRRFLLDALMVGRAVEEGAVFAHAMVEGISTQDTNHVEFLLGGSGAVVRGRVGVLATGAPLNLFRRLGIVGLERPSAIGLRCYVRSSCHLDRLLISYDRLLVPGYGWVFPMGEGLFNVGAAAFLGARGRERPSLKRVFNSFVSRFPPASRLMRNGDQVGPMRGAMIRCGLKGAPPLPRRNLMAIGEAVGSTRPFTGEGIGEAMQTGELAAAAIHKALMSQDFGFLEGYQNELERRRCTLYRGYQTAQSWFSRAWTCDLIARRIRESRFLQEAMVGIVSQRIDARDVFSLRGIVKSLLW